MENKTIIFVIIAVAVFVLGVGLGAFFQTERGQATAPKVQAVQTLSSKVIPSITAYGEVTKIEGRKITLTFAGDSLAVNIKNGAPVYLPAAKTTDKDGNPTASLQKTAEFEDVKKGDNVSVNLKLLPDGQIEGQLIIILSAK